MHFKVFQLAPKATAQAWSRGYLCGGLPERFARAGENPISVLSKPLSYGTPQHLRPAC